MADRNTGFVVALQTYVCTIGVRTVLQVACGGLPTIRNERQMVASEQSVDVPSVCVRFTLQG
jgi:hypothetical protein